MSDETKNMLKELLARVARGDWGDLPRVSGRITVDPDTGQEFIEFSSSGSHTERFAIIRLEPKEENN